MAERDIEWWFRVSANTRETGRKRIGNLLRDVADVIDGRESYALEMLSVPPVSEATRRVIVRKGIEHMGRLLDESAHSEAMDAGMKELCPKLYEADE